MSWMPVPVDWVEEHFKLVCVVSGFSCALSTCISTRIIYNHITNYTRPFLQRHIVRIQLVIPIYGIGSILSLKLRKHALYVETARDIYEAFVIYSFLQLVLAYLGGDNACVLKMEREQPLKHPPPLCFLKPMRRNIVLLRTCKKAAIQFVILKPVLAILSVTMLWLDLYESVGYQWFLFFIYNCTYAVALYGLFIFVLANMSSLAPFKPVWKYFAVKSVIIWTWYQSVLIRVVITPDENLASLWQDLLLSMELVAFALIHAFAFQVEEFKQPKHYSLSRFHMHSDKESLLPGEQAPLCKCCGCKCYCSLACIYRCCERCCEKISDCCSCVYLCCHNMGDVLSPHDMYSDAVHNFRDSYRDYALQHNEDLRGADDDEGGAQMIEMEEDTGSMPTKKEEWEQIREKAMERMDRANESVGVNAIGNMDGWAMDERGLLDGVFEVDIEDEVLNFMVPVLEGRQRHNSDDDDGEESIELASTDGRTRSKTLSFGRSGDIKDVIIKGMYGSGNNGQNRQQPKQQQQNGQQQNEQHHQARRHSTNSVSGILPPPPRSPPAPHSSAIVASSQPSPILLRKTPITLSPTFAAFKDDVDYAANPESDEDQVETDVEGSEDEEEEEAGWSEFAAATPRKHAHSFS